MTSPSPSPPGTARARFHEERAVRWYQRAARSGDRGLDDAALVFWTWWRNVPASAETSALACAFFTCAARAYVDEDAEERGFSYEAPFAEFGDFLRRFLTVAAPPGKSVGRVRQLEFLTLLDDSEERARLVLDWVETLELPPSERDACGRRLVALARGVLLSPGFLSAPTGSFWEMAAVSDKFPMRVFSVPVSPTDNGCFLSPSHERRFGQLFGLMPEAAVVRFAGHMGREARSKILWVPETDENGRLRRVLKTSPAEPAVRRRAFRSIVGNVADPARKDLVARLLGL